MNHSYGGLAYSWPEEPESKEEIVSGPVYKEMLGWWLAYALVMIPGSFLVTDVLGWSGWLAILLWVVGTGAQFVRPHSDVGEGSDAAYMFMVTIPVYLVVLVIALVAQYFLPMTSVMAVLYGIVGPLSVFLIMWITDWRDRRAWEKSTGEPLTYRR